MCEIKMLYIFLTDMSLLFQVVNSRLFWRNSWSLKTSEYLFHCNVRLLNIKLLRLSSKTIRLIIAILAVWYPLWFNSFQGIIKMYLYYPTGQIIVSFKLRFYFLSWKRVFFLLAEIWLKKIIVFTTSSCLLWPKLFRI